MVRAQSDCADDAARTRDPCASCGAAMKLAHIVPGAPGHEVRTWRCVACGEEKIDRVSIG